MVSLANLTKEVPSTKLQLSSLIKKKTGYKKYINSCDEITLLKHFTELKNRLESETLRYFEKRKAPDDPEQDFYYHATAYRILSPAEEYLILKVSKEDNYSDRIKKTANDLLYLHNQRLIINIAREYTNNKLTTSDLFDEGSIGFLEGIQRFDIKRGLRLSTYAGQYTRGYIQRALDEKSDVIRKPQYMKQEMRDFDKAVEKLLQEKKEITIDNLAKELNCSINTVELIYQARKEARSMNDSSDDKTLTLGRTLAKKNPIKPNIEVVVACIKQLDHKLAQILSLRFIEGKTLEELSKLLNLTREGIRQIEKKSLPKLNDLLSKQGYSSITDFYEEYHGDKGASLSDYQKKTKQKTYDNETFFDYKSDVLDKYPELPEYPIETILHGLKGCKTSSQQLATLAEQENFEINPEYPELSLIKYIWGVSLDKYQYFKEYQSKILKLKPTMPRDNEDYDYVQIAQKAGFSIEELNEATIKAGLNPLKTKDNIYSEQIKRKHELALQVLINSLRKKLNGKAPVSWDRFFAQMAKPEPMGIDKGFTAIRNLVKKTGRSTDRRSVIKLILGADYERLYPTSTNKVYKTLKDFKAAVKEKYPVIPKYPIKVIREDTVTDFDISGEKLLALLNQSGLEFDPDSHHLAIIQYIWNKKMKPEDYFLEDQARILEIQDEKPELLSAFYDSLKKELNFGRKRLIADAKKAGIESKDITKNLWIPKARFNNAINKIRLKLNGTVPSNWEDYLRSMAKPEPEGINMGLRAIQSLAKQAGLPYGQADIIKAILQDDYEKVRPPKVSFEDLKKRVQEEYPVHPEYPIYFLNNDFEEEFSTSTKEAIRLAQKDGLSISKKNPELSLIEHFWGVKYTPRQYFVEKMCRLLSKNPQRPAKIKEFHNSTMPTNFNFGLKKLKSDAKRSFMNSSRITDYIWNRFDSLPQNPDDIKVLTLIKAINDLLAEAKERKVSLSGQMNVFTKDFYQYIQDTNVALQASSPQDLAKRILNVDAMNKDERALVFNYACKWFLKYKYQKYYIPRLLLKKFFTLWNYLYLQPQKLRAHHKVMLQTFLNSISPINKVSKAKIALGTVGKPNTQDSPPVNHKHTSWHLPIRFGSAHGYFSNNGHKAFIMKKDSVAVPGLHTNTVDKIVKLKKELVEQGILKLDSSGLFYRFTRDYSITEENPARVAHIITRGYHDKKKDWGYNKLSIEEQQDFKDKLEKLKLIKTKRKVSNEILKEVFLKHYGIFHKRLSYPDILWGYQDTFKEGLHKDRYKYVKLAVNYVKQSMLQEYPEMKKVFETLEN